jgi:hypothetical protein
MNAGQNPSSTCQGRAGRGGGETLHPKRWSPPKKLKRSHASSSAPHKALLTRRAPGLEPRTPHQRFWRCPCGEGIRTAPGRFFLTSPVATVVRIRGVATYARKGSKEGYFNVASET